MSFYNTPFKHGKGVNKPFRSPLIKSDQNDNSPRRPSSSLKLNQNLKIRSLGLKSPMNSRGFHSPLKPLLLTSPSKTSESETFANGADYSSPLKRIENNLHLNRPRNNAVKLLYNDSSIQESEVKINDRQAEKDSCAQSKEFNKSPKIEKSGKNENHCTEEKDLVLEEKKLLVNLELKKTPPVSPKILQEIDSPEYQPVVKIQRLNQKIVDVYKNDLKLLIQRVTDKRQEMVELRAKIPLERKRNLEEIVVSIGNWREAFAESLETLRASLTEKNGRYFSTSDTLKLLNIPNNIVHFSEDMNDFIFPKI